MTDRQSGRTTRQLEMAPKNALYVWCNSYLEYPKRLCRQLEREDIKVITIGQVDLAMLGMPRFVVVDHDTQLTPKLAELITIHNNIVRIKK